MLFYNKMKYKYLICFVNVGTDILQLKANIFQPLKDQNLSKILHFLVQCLCSKQKMISYLQNIYVCLKLLIIISISFIKCTIQRLSPLTSIMLQQSSQKQQNNSIIFLPDKSQISQYSQKQKIYRRNSYCIHNLKRMEQWNWDMKDEQHRIFASKTSPYFYSRQQQVKYGLKREAARDFCLNRKRSKKFAEKLMEECGYQRGCSSYYATDESPIHTQKKLIQSYQQGEDQKGEQKQEKRLKKRGYQYHNFAFLSESFKNMEEFLIRNIDQKIVPFTKLDMSYIVPILRHSQSNFPKQQYDTFRKIVKVTFDLGSVSINIKPVMNFYRYVVYYLKERRQNGEEGKRFSGCFEENALKLKRERKKKQTKFNQPQAMAFWKLDKLYDQMHKQAA